MSRTSRRFGSIAVLGLLVLPLVWLSGSAAARPAPTSLGPADQVSQEIGADADEIVSRAGQLLGWGEKLEPGNRSTIHHLDQTSEAWIGAGEDRNPADAANQIRSESERNYGEPFTFHGLPAYRGATPVDNIEPTGELVDRWIRFSMDRYALVAIAGYRRIGGTTYPPGDPTPLAEALYQAASGLLKPTTPKPSTPGTPGTPGAADTVAPQVKAYALSGRVGQWLTPTFYCTDNSGQTRVTLTFYQRSVKGSTETSGWLPCKGKNYTWKYSFRWRTYTGGVLQFCMQAADRAGNKSARSCARITLTR